MKGLQQVQQDDPTLNNAHTHVCVTRTMQDEVMCWVHTSFLLWGPVHHENTETGGQQILAGNIKTGHQKVC